MSNSGLSDTTLSSDLASSSSISTSLTVTVVGTEYSVWQPSVFLTWMSQPIVPSSNHASDFRTSFRHPTVIVRIFCRANNFSNPLRSLSLVILRAYIRSARAADW